MCEVTVRVSLVVFFIYSILVILNNGWADGRLFNRHSRLPIVVGGWVLIVLAFLATSGLNAWTTRGAEKALLVQRTAQVNAGVVILTEHGIPVPAEIATELNNTAAAEGR